MGREAVRGTQSGAFADSPWLFIAVSEDDLRAELVERAYQRGFASCVVARLELLGRLEGGVLVADAELISRADPRWLERLFAVFRVGAPSTVLARAAKRLPAMVHSLTSELETLLAGRQTQPPTAKAGEMCLVLPPVELEPRSRRAWVEGRELGLRRAEFNMLHYLMTHTARVVPPAELITRVLGASGSGGSARTQVCELRRKLAKAGAPAVVETVRGSGYRFVATNGHLTKIQGA
jgi:DNA-binding winged helix-turn-helix (wHTH) protein